MTSLEGFRGGVSPLVIVAGPGNLILVYSPTPGPGNLIYAFSATSGTDPYGNTFVAGFSTADSASIPGAGSISLGGINNVNPTASLGSFTGNTHATLQGKPSGGNFASLDIVGQAISRAASDPVNGTVGDNVQPGSLGWFVNDMSGLGKVMKVDGNPLAITLGRAGQAQIILPNANDDISLNLTANPANAHGIKYGSGTPGGFHAEEMTLTGVNSLPTGAQTNLVPNGTTKLQTDYATGWAGAVFTVPADGWWHVSTFLFFAGTLVNQSQNLRILYNGTIYAVGVETGGPQRQSAELHKFMAKNDTVNISAFQASGAAITPGAGSHVTIQRGH